MIKLSCCIPGGSLMPEGVAGVPDSPARQIVDKCRYLLSLGYDCTECAGGMLADLTDEEAAWLVAENDRESLRLAAVNSLFPGNWKLADPGAPREEYLARPRRLFALMEKLHIPYAVFGSGGARSVLPDLEGSREALDRFVSDLGDIAAEHGLTLVIEPLRKRETNVFVTVPESGDAVRRLNHPSVRLLYDAFHMAEEGTDLSCVPEYADLCLHCHVAEAPARSRPGSEDSADPAYLRRFARLLVESGYEGAVSAECGFKDFKKDAADALAYMREIFAEAEEVSVTPVRDYREEPVYLVPERGAVSPRVRSAKTADGRVFPVSQYRDGVLAVLTAGRGEKLTLTLSAEPVGNEPAAVCDPAGHNVSVTVGGKPFGEYSFDPAVPKPFFGPVTDEAGHPFTRLDPTVKEHPHQRSVFVAVGDVNGIDCWNEVPGHGYVRTEAVEKTVSASAYAEFCVRNLWTDHGGKPLLKERTRYTVYNQHEDCRALDLEITFTAEFGEVVFGNTKEAGPLGIRVRDGLRADIGCGRILNSWGGEGEEECWSRSAEWCDYAGVVPEVGFMGITVFDSERNERFPTAWHVRNYGLFAANNLYFKGGLTIPAGESLTYRFRILFRRRPMSAGEIADRFAVYTLRPIDVRK